MKILFAGTPQNAARTLEGLLSGGHEIVAVLTRPDAEVGRKRTLTSSPVAQLAQERNLPVYKATQVSQELRAELAKTGAEMAVVVAYGTLLDQQTLDIFEKGWFNLHYSLLPELRGAAPVQRAIMNANRVTGVTLFKLDAGMDTGDLVAQVPVEINQRENTADLLGRLTEIGITLLNQELPKIAAGIETYSVQPEGQYPLAPKVLRTEALIKWNETALVIDAKVRALNPEPVAYTTLGGQPFRVLDAVALGSTDWASLGNDFDGGKAGDVRVLSGRVYVLCGGGSLLELKTVQPAGKKPMLAADWARGAIRADEVISFE